MVPVRVRDNDTELVGEMTSLLAMIMIMMMMLMVMVAVA